MNRKLEGEVLRTAGNKKNDGKQVFPIRCFLPISSFFSKDSFSPSFFLWYLQDLGLLTLTKCSRSVDTMLSRIDAATPTQTNSNAEERSGNNTTVYPHLVFILLLLPGLFLSRSFSHPSLGVVSSFPPPPFLPLFCNANIA